MFFWGLGEGEIFACVLDLTGIGSGETGRRRGGDWMVEGGYGRVGSWALLLFLYFFSEFSGKKLEGGGR